MKTQTKKNFTKTLASILAGGLMLAGCKYSQIEESSTLHEDATMTEKIYSPSRHDAELGLTAIKIGNSFGMDYGGNLGLGIGNGLQISSSKVPEKYGIVFRCKHGSFTSEGSDERHKNLYNRLEKNQLVDVTYKELYRATYDDLENSKSHKLTSRVLIDFDFLDAQPRIK